MANICDNKFYISCYSEETLEKIGEKLEKLFEETFYDGEITYTDEYCIEGWFESRWTFPEEYFEDFFEEYHDGTIYMRCLSEEYGCSYIALNIYSNGNWWKEQTFNF